FMAELSDEAIAIHLEFGPHLRNIQSGMHIYPLTGTQQRTGKTETAFSYRDAKFVHVIAGISPDGSDMAEQSAWVRAYWDALHPHSAGGTYVNFLMDEGDDRIASSYRENYARLGELKA